MPKPQGLLTIDQLREAVEQETIETIIVAFTDHYGRLVGKRFDADFFVEDIYKHGTHSCNYLLTTDMEMEPVPGYTFANWELGYGDFHLVPDFSTLRVAAWLDRTAMVICDVKNEKTHEYIDLAPRSLLRKQLKRAAQDGFEILAASELEYYLFENSLFSFI
jgi:glutamine synthetase